MGKQNVATVVETRHARAPRIVRVCGGLACSLAAALVSPGADLSDLQTEAGTGVPESSISMEREVAHSDVAGFVEGRVAVRYNRALAGEVDDPPMIIGISNERAHRRVLEGYRLAVHRLRSSDSCRDLFAELGVDGLDTLSRTIYIPPRAPWERDVCEAGAPAFTFVGAAQTRVCSAFGGLSRGAAAKILIHEALHHGGLGERPRDPDGPTPHQINRMIAKSCGL
jgi:hypothetical protein